MFDIGWSELVVIGIVALIAIGPKELPGVLRTVGHWMGKVRRMAAEFQGQFQEAMREAEVADLKKQVEDFNRQASDLASGFDPVTTANAEIQKAIDEITPRESAPVEPGESASFESSSEPDRASEQASGSRKDADQPESQSTAESPSPAPHGQVGAVSAAEPGARSA